MSSFSRAWLCTVALMLTIAQSVAADDDSSILLYSCFGGTVLSAILALWFAHRRPIEIDVDKVQREAMTIRRPPGFLKYGMLPKDEGLTTTELRSEKVDFTI